MRKKLAVAVTVALLAFPLSTAIAQACLPDAPISVASNVHVTTLDEAVQTAEDAVVDYELAPITTLELVTTAEGLKATAVAAIADLEVDSTEKADLEVRVTTQATKIATAKSDLRVAAAETAVSAYEDASIDTLAEIATAEGLKAAADAAVNGVGDGDANAAFELRVTAQATEITTTKTALQEAAEAAAVVVAAETAVLAYESAPITTLAEIATAEGLKAAAVQAVMVVSNVDTKTAFELRVTTQKAAIKAAKIELTPPVVEYDGKIVIPSTQFSDFIDNLQLALTFDAARQGEINKRHALRKLAQANKLMQDGNIEDSKICFSEYKDKIAKAQEFLNEAETPGSATAVALAKALENVEAKNIAVLSDLVVKLPPQVAQKLALNVVRTMDKAVVKVQKEEAKVAPVVVPVVNDDVEKKLLEKQAKAALLKFKNSVNEKNNLLQIKDREITDNQCTTDQKKLDVNQKLEKLSHINYRTSDKNKAGWNKDNDRDKNDDRNNDKGGDNNSRDHR
ncbi:MAG TPA: DUF5667 domain-containing protein [Desulfosporosinus sp.]|nr:DUF5667 domain-containing protein [Desulfosporosinus sp.]